MPLDDTNRRTSQDASGSGDVPDWLAEVTAVAAHELGNSITALTFAVDLLRERQRSVDERREVDDLRAMVAQASLLVRLLARLASPPTPPARLDLREVVSDAVPLLERLADLRLRCAIPNVYAPITMERSELERALVEIVLATRGREGETGIASLSVEREQQSGFRVVVEGAPAAEDVPALRHARKLAAASEGMLTLQQLENGALRIELSLRASPAGAKG